MNGWRTASMARDGLHIQFMPNGIHIDVETEQKHGHTILWEDLDEMKEYSRKLQERK